MTTEAEIHNLFTGHGAKTALSIPDWSIANRVPAAVLLEHPLPGGAGGFSYSLGVGPAAGVGALPGATLVNFINRIVALSFGAADGMHRAALGNAHWRAMYGVQNRSMPRVNAAGAPAPINLDTFPCHYCGLVVPEHLIEVDHQKPKAVGTKGAAVLKVFRGMNDHFGGGVQLTAAGPKGHKNQQTQSIAVAMLGPAAAGVPLPAAALATVAPKGRAVNQGFVNVVGTLPVAKSNRYFLSPEGETLLTVARMVLGRASLEGICLNHFLNLVPSCSACNGSKSDHVFYA